VNTAQIGVGYWGPNLLRNLISNKDCWIKSIFDPSHQRQQYVKSIYPSIEIAQTLDDVMRDPEIDAVVIATPAKTHFELVVSALENGKHVLVEKPMATSVSEAEKIAALADKTGLVVMVGHTFIYNSAVRYLKMLIDSGELGEIRYIYSQRVNLGRIRSDVDALWNFAPHDVSIIQYLLKDPAPISVMRKGMDYIQKGIEDVVFMNIHYPDKIMAHIHVSWLDPSRIRKMTIVGSRKMVIYDDIAINKIAIYDKGIDRMAVLGEHMDYDHSDFFNFNHRSGDVILPKIDSKEPLKEEISHFLDCIKNSTPCLTGPEHAKKVIQILSQ
jgi:predicted dehydrogenase